MRVMVAGASGAVGRQLVPRLVAAGCDVAGLFRTRSNEQAVRAMGAIPVVADVLDRDAVTDAVARFRPDVVVHELTALKPMDVRHFDRSFATTNRLRTEGTDNLLAAARAIGSRRFVAQSFAGWPYAREGAAIKSEDDALDPDPAKAMRATFQAVQHLETAVTGATWTEGIVLRYGVLYGPGTAFDWDGESIDLIRKGQFPIVGSGRGVWSFVHVEDAADATVAAVLQGERGIYNIVDDEPAPVSEWLPLVASRVGAKPPFRVPRWLGRILGGEAGAVIMTEVRGALNAKAKEELEWRPRHTWRTSLPGA